MLFNLLINKFTFNCQTQEKRSVWQATKVPIWELNHWDCGYVLYALNHKATQLFLHIHLHQFPINACAVCGAY